jgi:hypothetical protein
VLVLDRLVIENLENRAALNLANHAHKSTEFAWLKDEVAALECKGNRAVDELVATEPDHRGRLQSRRRSSPRPGDIGIHAVRLRA